MRAFSAACLLAALAVLPQFAVQAQDAVPDTPPELRDFRLDQPQSQPQNQPQPTAQPTPQAEPPPVVRTVPDTATQQPAPANRTAPAPRRAEVSQPSAASTTVGNEDASPEPIAEDVVTSEATVEPSAPVANDVTANPTPAPSNNNIGLFSAIAAAIAAIGILAFLWARRRRQRKAADADALPEIRATVAEEQVAAPAPKALTPTPRPKSTPAPSLAAAPNDVSIAFYPEKATVSFTTLTVQGQFQISNAGETAIRDMQLRAVLLSASSQQQSAVETFFAKPGQIPKNPLGDAKPGERLGLSLELSVPLNEMQTFPLGEQQLLVPIIVASLSYSDDQGNHAGEARLANMIGREAQPPQPKMGPLRLDKGPRSFAPLGQRPIYT